MAACQNCGNENRAGARYCRYCGQTLDELPETEPLAQAGEAPEISLPDIPYAGEAEIFDELEEALAEPPVGEVEASIPLPAAEPEAEDQAATVHDEEPAPVEEIVAVVLDEGEGNTPEPANLVPPLEASFDEDEPAEEFGALPAGVLLGGRYRVVELLSAEPEYRLYMVEDLLCCWSCGATQSDKEQKYCEACGAEQVQKPQCRLRAYLADQAPIEWGDCFGEGGYCYCLEAELPAEPAHQPAPPVRLGVGFRTHAGMEREINEDSLLTMQVSVVSELPGLPAVGFFAVADGIGGNEAGEIASQAAVRCLAAETMNQILGPAARTGALPEGDPQDLVKGVAMAANQAILDLRKQAATEINMGCTLTAALVCGLQAIVVNAGDSRTYLMRQGQLSQVTRDHSVVARLVEQGYISKDEIYTHNQKSVIYRSLGDRPDLEIDSFRLDLLSGDRLLLCSDGLWEMVRDPLIEEVLLERFDPQQACDRLVEMANLSGGEDNISVVVINIDVVS